MVLQVLSPGSLTPWTVIYNPCHIRPRRVYRQLAERVEALERELAERAAGPAQMS